MYTNFLNSLFDYLKDEVAGKEFSGKVVEYGGLEISDDVLQTEIIWKIPGPGKEYTRESYPASVSLLEKKRKQQNDSPRRCKGHISVLERRGEFLQRQIQI